MAINKICDIHAILNSIFVTRDVNLTQINFIGFDMDYTLVQYNQIFEKLIFNLAKDRLIAVGFAEELQAYYYNSELFNKGFFYDKQFGTLIKPDESGNILQCVFGLKILNSIETIELYPNKFVKLDDPNLHQLSTTYDKPFAYMLAAVVQYFTTLSEYKRSRNKTGFIKPNVIITFKSLFDDISTAFDWIHTKGSLKTEAFKNLELYVLRDERVPILIDLLRTNGKKLFLLTNSSFEYTNKMMSFIFNINSNARDWKTFFDYIIVEAGKPDFFAKGKPLKRVNLSTGCLQTGEHSGKLIPADVYCGGKHDKFTRVIGSKGRDVLFIGDSINGDMHMAKLSSGWRTFFVLPEIQNELKFIKEKKDLFDKIDNLDEKNSIDGKMGGILSSGNRRSHFANQIMNNVDIYSSSFMNLIYYPLNYSFKSISNQMPHEVSKSLINIQNQTIIENMPQIPNVQNNDQNVNQEKYEHLIN